MPAANFISVLIPTYNEEENIAEILKGVKDELNKINLEYEILVIDDASLDNTAIIAKNALGQNSRLISRCSCPRSLSLSVLEGIKQSRGDIIVVMDADGSHPPELIPCFIKNIEAGYDLVIASRYVKGGSSEGFPLTRKIISRAACILGRVVTRIKDNTSGFFCIRKSALEGVSLTPRGFKIGLEIFIKANFSLFKEIPYIFVNRKRGKSKLGKNTVGQYLFQVLGLLIYKVTKQDSKTK